jgi:hypothetical protein
MLLKMVLLIGTRKKTAVGRNNADFRQSALYHGTVHPFQAGDVVKPGEDREFAYATTNLDYARTHADRRLSSYWEKGKQQNPTWNRPGGKQYDEWEKENPARVFEVEPIGEPEPTSSRDLEDKGNVKSKKGFRVVREVK